MRTTPFILLVMAVSTMMASCAKEPISESAEIRNSPMLTKADLSYVLKYVIKVQPKDGTPASYICKTFKLYKRIASEYTYHVENEKKSSQCWQRSRCWYCVSADAVRMN